MYLLLTTAVLIVVFAVWHHKQNARWKAQERRQFVRENVRLLSVAIKDVTRLADKYCPDDAHISKQLVLARGMNESIQKQFGDGTDNNAVEELEPMLKIGLQMIGETRMLVRSRMTPDQVEEEERGERKPQSK